MTPFLPSTLLFSSISPDYEGLLKEEIDGCIRYMKFSFTEIMNMPIRDRKMFINKHNGAELKRKEEASHKGKRSNDISLMNNVTRMMQENAKNRSSSQ